MRSLGYHGQISSVASAGSTVLSGLTIGGGAVDGDSVYVSANDTVSPADADAGNASSRVVGIVSGTKVVLDGEVTVNMVAGLTPVAGDLLYQSTTAGKLTTVAPGGSGDIVVEVGFILDASAYSDPGNLKCQAIIGHKHKKVTLP